MIEPLGQEALPQESGVPRWGCYFMDLCAMPQLVYQVRYSRQTILKILDHCRHLPNWDKEHMIIDYGPPSIYPYGKEFSCYLWNPGKVLDVACQYAHNQAHGYQVCDENGWYNWADPKHRWWTFLVKQIRRPKGYHYDLHDAAHRLVYNPLPRIQIPYTGHWIGFALGEV